ncbi:DUF427 domain-containing protein [Actinokineospora sp. HUAS TT18]|uniref:DUF427 domain-containing protein n=1 Tax=Actinokineospora sp. HUAS TT18 TaxID=3447451 RepID=UPI003F51D858
MAIRFASALPDALTELRYDARPQRIRVSAGGRPIADTTDAYLIWEPRRVVPMYAVPWDDFTAPVERAEHVEPAADLPRIMGPENFDKHSAPGHEVTIDGGFHGSAFQPDDPDLGGRVILEFGAFDWLEEDDTVIGHPHDPYKRIDVLQSSRRVRIALDGQVLADSTRAMMLLETHLPVRWYFPRADVRLDVLTPTDAHTICAYKGHAAYFSYEPSGFEGSNIGWTYVDPLHDALRVKDYISFYGERVDTEIDGVLGERPVTPWSRPW